MSSRGLLGEASDWRGVTPYDRLVVVSCWGTEGRMEWWGVTVVVSVTGGRSATPITGGGTSTAAATGHAWGPAGGWQGRCKGVIAPW